MSGRMTPTPPEPLAVIDLSSDMVVKLRLKVVAETVWAEAGATWRAMPASTAVMATDAVPSVLTLFEISMLFPFNTSDEVEQLKCEPTTSRTWAVASANKASEWLSGLLRRTKPYA